MKDSANVGIEQDYYFSVDEYLKFEDEHEERHEYVRGQIFAMSGATEAHNAICSNLHGILYQLLDGSKCRVFQHGMKVRVETTDCFYYPDIMVTCEPYDGKSVFKSLPTIIIEVLSPSTKHIDRREKLVAYRTLESLQQYILVHQDRFLVEVYTRNTATEWIVSMLHERQEVTLRISAELQPKIPVSSIYRSVDPQLFVKEPEEEYIIHSR